MLTRLAPALILAAGCGAPDPEQPPAEEPVALLDEEPAQDAEELTPRQYDRRGDEHLRAGRFEQAIADFDRFLASEPEFGPHHWRRGIALYYAGEYAAGAAQFESHRLVNPADVENATWHFLCVGRERGVDAARAGLLPVGTDSRPPMMTVYELYAGRASAAEVLAEAARGGRSALFYGHLYVGLLHDALGDREAARHHIDLAVEHASGGYMGDIARVHARVLADAE